MRVFLTGSTGFIGARLTEKLINEGHEVALLVRNPPAVTFEPSDKVTVLHGDLFNNNLMLEGMKDCDRVFHLAAYAKPTHNDPSQVSRINVEGTRNILDAAVHAGVKKVVFTSTAGTMSYSYDGRPVDEQTNSNPELHTLYEKTKAEAEKIAVDFSKKGLHVVIVNPTRVYGPGKLSESNSLTKIIKSYISGSWRIIPGDGESIGNYVFIDDIIDGHLLAAEHGRSGERYILGGENHTFHELFSIISDAAGNKRHLFHLSSGLMKNIIKMAMFYSKTTRTPPFITLDWLDKYLNDWIMSSDKAIKELGYRITPLRNGVSQTIQWLKTLQDGSRK